MSHPEFSHFAPHLTAFDNKLAATADVARKDCAYGRSKTIKTDKTIVTSLPIVAARRDHSTTLSYSQTTLNYPWPTMSC